MSAETDKPTPAEIDQAKQLYNDVNDYLKCLTDIIQTKVQEFDSEDSDEEELSPLVSQFLNDYNDYISSLPKVHTQLANPDLSTSSRLRKRFWRYSQTHQTLKLFSPNLPDLQKLCEAKLDRDVQASPSFSTSLPTINNSNGDEKLLINDSSPSVSLLKAQLGKYTKKNCIVIRSPKYTFDDTPIEEKKIAFVVRKSSAAIVSSPTIEPPKQESIKVETEEKNTNVGEIPGFVKVIEKNLSEEKAKKSFDLLLSSFLSITKVGFSKSHLSSLVWT